MKRARNANTKPILIRLPDELVEILEERVEEEQRRGDAVSRSYLIVQAVEQYLTLQEVA